jgi:NitT/TauT family transport system substrate-binding protein
MSVKPAIAVSRRRFLKTSALGLGGLAVASRFLSINTARADNAEVNMQLGWLASNGIVGEVVGNSLGYYQEEGVNLTITAGGPNIDGVASVASGQAQTGQLSSSPSLMLARSAGIPVKCIAAGYQQHPFTYFSLDNAPIRTPQDMVGKIVATQPTAKILLRALLAKNGIAEDQVEVVNMGSDMNQLMTGQVQAVTGWLTNTNALKILGDGRVDMRLWDTGIQLYANVYYTTDDMLQNHSDALAGFLRASARGWGYAKEHPEEAVDMLVKAYPNLDKASELEAIGMVLGFSFNEQTAAKGWGTMEPDNWQTQIDIYAGLGQFAGDVPKVDDVMTLAILDASADARPKIA